MSVNLDQALGATSTPTPVGWNQRDLLLYAVSIGFKEDQLEAVYELHENWSPVPFYPLVLSLKGASEDVVNFASVKDLGKAVPGLPVFDPNKVVHATQGIEIFKSIPAVSGKGWTLSKQVTGIKDTGKGLIVETSHDLTDASGDLYARITGSSYNFGNFNANKYDKNITPKAPATPLAKPPTRPADVTETETISKTAAILYRLSADYNPLHIDPKIGAAIGFGGVILHGLCTYGNVGRQIITHIAKGDSKKFKYIFARFTSPVRPGDELETKFWTSKFNEGGITGTRVDFVASVKGKTVLGPGVAIISDKDVPGPSSTKL